LCHDLIGPIGAVSNGVEILYEENDPAVRDQALDLMAMSAGEAARRTEYYRVAFGAAAGRGADVEVNDLRRIAGALFERGRVSLEWPEPSNAVQRLGIEGGKLALNLILLAASALPRGGTVLVELQESEDSLDIVVSATGQRAGLDEDVLAALRPHAEGTTIERQTAQPYLAARLVERLGGNIEVVAAEGRVDVRASIASKASPE
jgi:histidine phosphotransferase ChpT